MSPSVRLNNRLTTLLSALLPARPPQAHEGDCCLMGYDLNSDGTGNKHLTAAFCGQGSDKPHSEKASDVRATPAPPPPTAPLLYVLTRRGPLHLQQLAALQSKLPACFLDVCFFFFCVLLRGSCFRALLHASRRHDLVSPSPHAVFSLPLRRPRTPTST